MAKRDYYDVLGLSNSASDAEIKAAYRKLARQYHPDVNKSADAEQKFKEVNEAFQVLSDREKRAAYDQFGHAAFRPGGTAGAGPFGGPGGFRVDFDFGGGFADPFEIFEQFFGSASPFGFSRRPTMQVHVSFDEALVGTEREVRIDGRMSKIRIPPGVDTGTHIRFDEFTVVVDVEPHKQFQRDGANMHDRLDITPAQAVLGDTVEVSTILKPVKVKVPVGIQPGTAIRLAGKGMPRLRGGGHGDHYVHVRVVVPKNASSRERALYEEIRAIEKLPGSKKPWFGLV